MNPFFDFEADFVDSLRCIPMSVRLKLDTCGVKLKLPQWHQLSEAERQSLVTAPCTTPEEIASYRSRLRHWVLAHTGDLPADLPIDPAPDWSNPNEIPQTVQAQAESHQVTLTPDQWHTLTPLQRFALAKLSRSQHEHKNFLPALREFHIIS